MIFLFNFQLMSVNCIWILCTECTCCT